MPGNRADGERERSTPDLRFERLTGGNRPSGFSCGDPDLDAFLATAEVDRYDHERLGKTYLVYMGGELAAYFTVSAAELRIEYLLPAEAWAGVAAMHVDAIPALKVGRLAVNSRFQRRGIGMAVVHNIVGMALEAGGTIGVRMVTLQAKPQSVGFYERLGFEYAALTRRERRRKNRTMFFDLDRTAGGAPA